MDGSDDVLAAHGALAHPLSTLGAGDHVTALQQHAVDGGVHTDLTEVLLQTSGANTTRLWRRRSDNRHVNSDVSVTWCDLSALGKTSQTHLKRSQRWQLKAKQKHKKTVGVFEERRPVCSILFKLRGRPPRREDVRS